MRYKLAYIDEQDGSLSNFYSHFESEFDLVMIKVEETSTIESILKLCFDEEADAIVTDYKLEEEGNVSFNGDSLFLAIKSVRPHFPVIMLTSWEPEAIDHMEDVHIIYNKDILNGRSAEEFAVFKSKIKSSIENHYSKIKYTNDRVEELIKKRNEGELSVPEEEELTKLYMLFDELQPEGKDLPASLIPRESITKLSDFVQEARNILEELKKRNNSKQ